MLRETLFNFIGRSDGDRSYNWNYKNGVRRLFDQFYSVTRSERKFHQISESTKTVS